MRLPSGETLGAPTALSLSCISGSHVCPVAAEAKRTTRVRAVTTYFMIFLLSWITDDALSFYSRLLEKVNRFGTEFTGIHRLHRFTKNEEILAQRREDAKEDAKESFYLGVFLCVFAPLRENLCNLW